MITFEEIMTTCERQNIGTVVRNCAKTSIKEAKEASKNHPGLKTVIFESDSHGTCVQICPAEFMTADDIVALHVKGHKALKKIFRSRK